MAIKCFTGTSLENNFDVSTKGMSDEEARQFGKQLVAQEHEKLHNELNGLKKGLGLNVTKYKPLDFAKKEEAIRSEYDDKINEAKAENKEPKAPIAGTPKPPPNTEVPTDAGHQSGTGISKQAILEQYGVKFEHSPLGWNERTQRELGVMANDAERKGISVADHAESMVTQMAEDIKNGKLEVSDNKIVGAALHLINMDEAMDKLNSQNPETATEKSNRALSLDMAETKQQIAIGVLDKLGSASGGHLGFFANMFSKNSDGGLTTYRNIISGAYGIDVPETEAALDKSDLSAKDKEKIRPYVQKLEKIKAEYEGYKKTAKAASPKSTAAKQAKSQKAVDKLLSLAKDVRSSDFFEKYNLGKPIKGSTQGFTFDVQENLAKGLEYIAAGIKKGEELIDLIKEAANKFKGNNDENDFAGLINHVLKQNQELESFIHGRIDANKDAMDAARMRQQMRTLGQLRALADTAKKNNEKWWQTAADFHRTFIIGGLQTLLRVLESGAAKLFVDPLANLTFGNIASRLPGLEKQAITPTTMAEGFESLIKFKNAADAKAYVDQKVAELDMASKNLATDPTNRDFQTAYQKASLENAKADIYNYIHANNLIDSMQLAKYGSTDFEQMMGGYTMIDPTMLRGAQKVAYWLNSFGRLHGVEKNPSARRSFVESYNNHLLNFQKEGVQLSASTRMRATNMAYEDGFLPGKYQNKTQLSELTNRLKYMINKPENIVEKAYSFYMASALPVAKIAINLVKSGVDASTLGIEGVIRYSANASKNFYENNKISKIRAAQGLEYDSIWQNLLEGAKDLPAKDRAYIHNIIKKGLFGAALYAYAAWGVSNGTIQYGGEYDEDHHGNARRRYKKPDGTWSEPGDLDYGQWVINGHKFGKFASSVLNHVPEFLPMALAVNTHNVYKYEHEYEGSTGDRQTRTKTRSSWEAIKSDINEITERLPYRNLTKPADVFTSMASVPLAKDLSEHFDKDSEGNLIQRQKDNPIYQMLDNAGLRVLTPKVPEK